MRRLAPKLAQSLAAEYVVGTLRGRARKRFEAIARADPAVASEVRRWEDELTPLAARVAAVEPPARVWTAIEERIAPRSASPSFWSNLAFWRSFGLVAGGMAGVLIAAFLWLSPGSQGGPEFVAVLTSADAVPRVVVSMHPHHMLRVQTMHPWPKAAGKSLELWAMPKDGPPRSLGLVHNEVSDTAHADAGERHAHARRIVPRREPGAPRRVSQAVAHRTGALLGPDRADDPDLGSP